MGRPASRDRSCLIVLFGAYLTRAIACPSAARPPWPGRLAGGDLAVRMPETGAGEIGELERAFNPWRGLARGASRDELRRLAEEQAALRRVATLVARTESPAEVFETVTREVGLLSGADLARMERYEPDGTVTGVAGWSRGDDDAAGRRHAVRPRGGEHRRAGAGDGAVRCEWTASPTPPVRSREEARALGIRSSVGCPIVVEGRLWGVIAASSKGEAPFPADTESQIAEFTELVATAIANAESRAELAASRARVVTTADETRRRVVRDLHDGAQQRLVHTVVTLKLRTASARRTTTGPRTSSSTRRSSTPSRPTPQLRELAHGILPSVLTRGGLRAGDRGAGVAPCRLPRVRRRVRRAAPAGDRGHAPTSSWPRRSRTSSSTLAPTARRSRRWSSDDVLHLEVRDDGVGGARLDGSTGLLGLHDRVGALDGELVIESPPGGGTLITATLPIRDTARSSDVPD